MYYRQNISIATLAAEWLEYVHCHLKISTYAKYRSVYEKYIKPLLKGIGNKKITQEDVNDFVAKLMTVHIPPGTKPMVLVLVRQIFSYAEKTGRFPLFFVREKIKRRISRPIEALSIKETNQLFDYLYKNIDTKKLGIIICFHTGLRLGEICGLKWQDIDINNRLLSVRRNVQRVISEKSGSRGKTHLLELAPKTDNSRRAIPLPDEILCLMLKFRQIQDDYILLGDRPMEPRRYQYTFQKYLKEAGLSHRNFHIIRHTFATRCVENGIDAKALSELLGHSNVNITLEAYVHPTIAIKRQYILELANSYKNMRKIEPPNRPIN